MAGKHLVVDGSNIATEGRAAPSLAQLDEAVRALLADQPYDAVTVVVDATFGHRIDPSEREAFEEAALSGEVLTPPAGAIGRGDAFILQIADRAGADVFSNDSFQEFHGQYTWLFDEGRLIGGKPVPNVGWVFVLRAPVRGPTSRRSVRDAKKVAVQTEAPKTTKKRAKAVATGAAKATPAPTKAKSRPKATPAPAMIAPPAAQAEGRRSRRRRGSGAAGEPLNTQHVYVTFVVDHPIGSTVEGVVERFSSHGAYITVGDAQCYVPLRELGDPPPRSAREVLNLGETRTFVVRRFDPERRGIDVVPAAGLVTSDSGDIAAKAVAPATGNTNHASDAEEAPVSPAAKKAAAKKKAARKKAPAKKKAAAKRAPAKRKTAAKRAPAKKRTVKKAAKKKAPAKRKAAAKRAPAKRKAAAKRAPAKKRTVKKAAKRKAPAKKRAAKKRS
jgi:hypothetical protein